MPAEKQLGFICPEWARPYWDAAECTIEPCSDGTFAVVDHSLNGVTIAVERTYKECAKHLS
jgi:hypothetical protein